MLSSCINRKAKKDRFKRISTTGYKQKSYISEAGKRFRLLGVFLALILPFYPSLSALGASPESMGVIEVDESSILEEYVSAEDAVYVSDSGYLRSIGSLSTSREHGMANAVVPYIVKSGDTISGIAWKFVVSAAAVMASNDLTSKSVLKVGSTLYVPTVEGVVHTIVRGETMDSIANDYGSESDKITAANGLRADKITAGDHIVIPGVLKKKVVPVAQKTQEKVTATVKKTAAKAAPVLKKTAVGVGNKGAKWFVWGNCTYYVATKKNVSWRGNANMWFSNARAQGIPTGRSPTVGAIVTFRGGEYNRRYGHVGIVEEVYSDHLVISDMNYRGLNVITVRKVPIDNRIEGYIYVD